MNIKFLKKFKPCNKTCKDWFVASKIINNVEVLISSCKDKCPSFNQKGKDKK